MPGRCDYLGTSYEVGAQFMDEEDCNLCTCAPDRSIVCTRRFCPKPPYQDGHRCSGHAQCLNGLCLDTTCSPMAAGLFVDNHGGDCTKSGDGLSRERAACTIGEVLPLVQQGRSTVLVAPSAAEEVLRAGDCAGFPRGEADGHHLQNRSDREAVVLGIGSDDPQDETDYPDIDLRHVDGYVHKDGRPYAAGAPPKPAGA